MEINVTHVSRVATAFVVPLKNREEMLGISFRIYDPTDRRFSLIHVCMTKQRISMCLKSTRRTESESISTRLGTLQGSSSKNAANPKVPAEEALAGSQERD